jgi:hypothetical protein
MAPRSRRPPPLVPTLGLALAIVVSQAPSAAALPSTTPDLTWMTNGPVRSVVQIGGAVYLGGQFTALCERPSGTAGACGPGATVAVSNLAAIDIATGQPLGYDPGAGSSSFAPQVGGGATPIVYDLEAFGNTLAVGGKFSKVDGLPRKNLALIDVTTGVVDTSFKPRPAGKVFAVELSVSRVYAGGTFTTVTVGGIVHARDRLASFQLDGAIDTTWTPSADDQVRDLAFALDDGSTIFAAGDFTAVNGLPRQTIAKLDAGGSGAPTSWSPGGAIGVNAWGNDLFPTPTTLYVAEGGSDFAVAFDAVAGTQLWKTDTNGAVQAITVLGDRPVIGGHFRYVQDDPGESCGTTGGTCARHRRLAALDPANGFRADASWNPAVEGIYRGVWSLLPDAARLYVAGEFLEVTGVLQQYFARLS